MSVNSGKGLISVNNTKYLLPFVILYLNAEVGGLSMRLKIKKEIQNKNNKSKKINKKLKFVTKLGLNHNR